MSDSNTNNILSVKKRNLITALMCLIGIFLNLFFGTIAEKSGAPLYLDTVGTIVASIIGGFLPGVIVGFSTNIFKSISDTSALYYGVLNVLISVTASYLTKKGFFKKPLKTIAAIIVFALIGGGIGSFIPIYLDDVPNDSGILQSMLYDTGIMNERTALIISNVLVDLLDKTISVIMALIILRIIPGSLKRSCRFIGWMQTPLSEEDSEAAKKTNFRVISLRTKIMLALSISLIAVSVAATGISMKLYRNALIKDHIKIAEGAANIAASTIDTEMVDEYIKNGESSEGYIETEKILTRIRESSTDIKYLYVYKIEKEGCRVVFDVDNGEDMGSEHGELLSFDKTFIPLVPDLLEGKEIDPIISNDQFGWLLTVYKPVLDKSGNCVCYAAADVSMDMIGSIERKFFVEMLSLFLGFFILIFVFVRWLVEYHIVLPVNSIALSTGTFAYDSENARVNSIERIHDLKIHTGDEVENLYHAIAKTSDDSMKYVADVQKKTQELAQMQNALIIVLADIVESRDENTGAHVRKTARYTEIILNSLRKKGYYNDELTDQFISDVVHSAPLHDIGKIQVPDAILNKPGKLTDEEFEIMKKHTTAGHNIISQAISLVPNSGYLSEARNLAAYHHEKWNGTGYPYGLSGEDIPLSARVMAVADVFDALVSKRSYKDPFTFDEAMKIIREGSGKHFDPLVVEAFLSEEAEVKEVANNFKLLTDETGRFNRMTSDESQ
ncbi:HD domain-containing phosphohydrolase [Ruminococcus sp. XPD3002]|uniref:HD domain-containing phosphohydrolase n=1 Tax=Ruminococcus sp. XPD3002 TaxID=1452269 RepID=UPI00091A5686|nr:HD domain-containing protein [Ruminococcus flavefaciens]